MENAEGLCQARNENESDDEHIYETLIRRSVTLDTQLFLEVAKQIGKEYFLVGMALCDDKPLMERTELAHPRDIQRVMFDILSHWKNNSPKRNDPAAMVEELCCVLTRNDRNDLVEYIRGQSRREDNTQPGEATFDTRQSSEGRREDNTQPGEATFDTRQSSEGETVDLCGYAAKDDLLQQLRSYTTIDVIHLKLDDNNFSSKPACKGLGEILTSMTSLQSLSLSRCQLTTDGVKCLAEGLSNCRTLEKLLLSENDFSSRGAVKALNKMVISIKALATLRLSHNDFSSPEAGAALVKIFTSMSKLQSLNISCCCLSDEGLKTVAASLAQCTNLEKLQLAENDFSRSSTCRTLSVTLETLGSLKQLTTLSLKCCKLTDDGAMCVAKSLARHSQMKVLDLSKNDMSNPSTGQALGESLNVMHQLQNLGLKGCHLNGTGTSSVVVGLSQCSQMKMLDLSENDFGGNEAFTALLENVRNMKNLQDLSLAKCQLSSQVKELLKGCVTCKVYVD
ncbi:hypothetical protein LSAT2_006274 [Lamellibrachia satsuma]|nr:hypothetical protein LSAT2_006274 [Lamellibrachia satsuma]